MAGGTPTAILWWMSQTNHLVRRGLTALLLMASAATCGETTPDAGESAAGGTAGLGGRSGTGGSGGDSGVGVACSDDAGLSPPAAARECTHASDCTIQIAPTCCGADRALGVATAAAAAYAACFGLPPGACNGLGCAKYLGYSTDTGQITPDEGTATNPIDSVSVRCLDSQCTTDVIPTDGGQDAGVDAGGQSCGSTSCHSGQACVLYSGGPAPRCQAPGDGGCPTGLVSTNSCYDPATGVQRTPGCTDPPPAPGCVDLPDGCSDVCACVCGTAGGGGCSVTSLYVLCARP
jgi:hypothetical protein